jgi:hypothetical protein
VLSKQQRRPPAKKAGSLWVGVVLALSILGHPAWLEAARWVAMLSGDRIAW